MRILTNHVHTGYDYELAKMGHEWFALEFGRPWDTDLRPLPPNWHVVKDPARVDYDVILAQWLDGARAFAPLPGPMIWNVVADCSEGEVDGALEARVHAVNFLAHEVADRWQMADRAKKRVIEMALDPATWGPYVGDGMGHDVLTVGYGVGDRWDKGRCQLLVFDQVFGRVDLAGPANEGLRPSIGTLSPERLCEAYRHYKVYFNPGPVVGISVAEAMLSGMPVVTFRPITLNRLIVDEVTALVTDTLDGAHLRIRRLLGDPALRARIGQAGQALARRMFDPVDKARKWTALFAAAKETWQRVPALTVR